MTHKVVVCMIDPRDALHVLNQAIEQCKYRNADLHLLFCQHELCRCSGMDPVEVAAMVGAIEQSATQSCQEAGIGLTIEAIADDLSSQSMISRLVLQLKAELLILSHNIPDNVLKRLLPTPAEKLAHSCSCSVLLVR